MKKIYTTIIISFITLCSFGQIGTPQNFMKSNPYFNTDNPAHFTPYNGYFGLPGLSNLNLSFTNTAFTYKNIFVTDTEGYPTSISLNKFVDKLRQNNNRLNFNLSEEILGFGFRTNNLFFSFAYRVKADMFFSFSKDLFAFPLKGNMNYLGEDNKADINLKANANAYQEISLGVQMEVTKRLSIGVRPKLLIGLLDFRTNELNASIFTDPNDYSMRLNYNANATLFSAMPITFDENNDFSIDFSNIYPNVVQNLGFSVDLGGVYRITQRMGVGLSVSDLGFIKWKGNGQQLTSAIADNGSFYDDGSFFFNGLTADQLQSLMGDNENSFIDSLAAYFPLNTETIPGKKTMLNARLAAEFYFDVKPNHRFSAVAQGCIVGKRFLPGLTIAYSGKLAKVFDLMASYSMMPGSYGNLGVGIGFDLWPIYLYVASNNVIVSTANPLNTKHFNVSTGFVFKWGRAKDRWTKKIELDKAEEQNNANANTNG